MITITPIGIDEVIKGLNELKKKVKNLTPVMNEIGNYIKNESELSFEKQQSPFGEKWKPLSVATLTPMISYTKKGKVSKASEQALKGRLILVRSGRLVNSITYKADASSVTIGTNLIYAAIHQFGGKAGRNRAVNIPARPYMPISKTSEMPNKIINGIINLINAKIAQK